MLQVLYSKGLQYATKGLKLLLLHVLIGLLVMFPTYRTGVGR